MIKQPLYLVIYNDLLKKIKENYYKKNDLMPSETELGEFYGASRITVRRAMQELQDRGYVTKFSGKGTIVNDKKLSFEIVKEDSFSNEVKMKNLQSNSILLEFKEIVPSLHIQVNLNLGKDDKVYYIERIRKIENEIIGLEKSYITKKKNIKLKKEDFENSTSLYALIASSGVILHEAVENMEAILPTDEIMKKLEISKDIPIFYKERITYDDSLFPIEYVEMFYSSSKYKYKLKLRLK